MMKDSLQFPVSFFFFHWLGKLAWCCRVFESITVVAGRQLQVTVLAFSCLTTTQCSMSSAVGGGSWLRMGGGLAATGSSSPRNWPEAGKIPAKLSSCSLFSLSRPRLSMAILVTRRDVDTLRRRAAC